MKNIIKKLMPAFMISFYHFLLAWLGALLYGFPSKKLTVIGVTGTKGKSTVVSLAGRILEEGGARVGWVSSLSVKIANQEALNQLHLTMPGRFFIQKALAQMVKEKCEYALIEVTSEGIKQHRHRFIDFDEVVFTNLAPEHIEAHGGYEQYKEAKGKLFKALKKKGKMVVNLDDREAKYFMQFEAAEKIGFGLEPKIPSPVVILGHDVQVRPDGIYFLVHDVDYSMKLLGKFNVYNALAAIAIAFSQGFNFNVAKKALEKIDRIEGRMEEIKEGQDFRIFVDLAHTPDSFEQVFALAKQLPHQRIIAVFGSAGGGRDKWKRPKLGEIAAKNADLIILTNEDPYDEVPEHIILEIEKGLGQFKKYEIIVDRRQAIYKALKEAQIGDIVLVLGKGTEATLVIGQDKKPWDDRAVVKEELERI